MPERRRLIILAQFDPENGLPAHVRIHLEALRLLATRLVLVSNSPLKGDSRAQAEALCDTVLERENIGWDFAAWRDALAAEDISTWDNLILTNSSVVGPLHPLGPIVTRMDTQADFWGMLRSREVRLHLPSFFLSFSAPVIRSDAWRTFWTGIENLTDKQEVIWRYETTLTQHLTDAGFTHDALIPDLPFPQNIGRPQFKRRGGLRIAWDINERNRSLLQHTDLIAQGMPYLKASLLWGSETHQRDPMDRIKAASGPYPWEDIDF